MSTRNLFEDPVVAKSVEEETPESESAESTAPSTDLTTTSQSDNDPHSQSIDSSSGGTGNTLLSSSNDTKSSDKDDVGKMLAEKEHLLNMTSSEQHLLDPTSAAMLIQQDDNPQNQIDNGGNPSLPGAYRVSLQPLQWQQQRDNLSDDILPGDHPPASLHQPTTATNGDLPVVVEATIVTEQAESRWKSDVYDAVLLLPSWRNLGRLAILIVVLAIVLGTAIPLTRPDPAPVVNTPSTVSALSWINNSSVAIAAKNLPQPTVAAIQADMNRAVSSSNSSTATNASFAATLDQGDWYSNEIWVGSNYQPQDFAAQAWKWLVSNSTVANYTPSEVTTRFALAVFYYQTGGPSWTDSTNWLEPSKHVCDWYTYSRIKIYRDKCLAKGFTEFALTFNGLFGVLPRELGLLTDLITLEIRGHRGLKGSIPTTIGNLSRLRFFNLNSNQISGTIPTEIGMLTKLQLIHLEVTNIEGDFPLSMYKLSNLEFLHASFYIPTESPQRFPDATLLGNWTKLRDFLMDSYLTGRFSFGTLPTAIGLATNLELLALEMYPMEGTLPSEIGELTKLTTFSLKDTQLEGTLPETMAKLTNLQLLSLGQNKFTGPISDAIVASWSKLTNLFVSENYFSGTLSSNIGLLTIPQYVVLENNQFSGTLPTELGLLTSTELLYMRNNRFSGEIPSELASLSKLRRLDLDGMPLLSGAVPPELCNRTLKGQGRMTVLAECSETLTCDGCCILSALTVADNPYGIGNDDFVVGACTKY